MSDELKEHNILKLILIMRFACATIDVGHPIYRAGSLVAEVEPGLISDLSLIQDCIEHLEKAGARNG
jgi:hypothetical protein